MTSTTATHDDASSAKPRSKQLYLIKRMTERLQKVRDRKWILAMLDAVPTYGRGRAAERQRAMRDERVRACAEVLIYLVGWMSETSRIVWHHPEKGIIGRRLCDLVEATGLDERRVDRAIRDLKAAGYLDTWERCEYDREADQYRGIAAIRQITQKLLVHLGLFELWTNCARKRVERERRKKLAQAAGAAPTLRQLRAKLAAGANAARVMASAVTAGHALPARFRPPG